MSLGLSVSAYIINLKDSHARYAYVLPMVEKLGVAVHRVEAVDGSLLSLDETARVVDKKSYQRFYEGKEPGPGTVGCFLSHLKAWEMFLESDQPYGLILEDDIHFKTETVLCVLNELLLLTKKWDICSFALRRRGWPWTLKRLMHGRRLCLYMREVHCAGAYILSRRAAKALLNDALPMQFQLDDYYLQTWRWGLAFTGVEPRIVFHDDGGVSEIKKRGRRQSRGKVFRWDQTLCYILRSHAIRVSRAFRHFFYNMATFIRSYVR